MAKKKTGRKKARKKSTHGGAKRVAKKKRKGGRKKKKFLSGLVGSMVAALAYGAVRGRLANAVHPVATKYLGQTMGQYADEAGIVGALYGIDKTLGKKIPFVRQVTQQGMILEAAAVGQSFTTRNVATSTSGGGVPVI